MFGTRAMFICVLVGALVLGSGCANVVQMPDDDGGDVPAGATAFFATLSGDQEVPPVEGDAMGEAALTLNDDETEIVLDISATGISGTVIGMHLHRAAAGANGDVVLNLTDTVVDSGDGRIGASGSVAISSETLSDLRAGIVYLNIHTANNPGGEIRGQFGPAS